jgi:hypothetical protein
MNNPSIDRRPELTFRPIGRGRFAAGNASETMRPAAPDPHPPS